jgi:hypothetical protein
LGKEAISDTLYYSPLTLTLSPQGERGYKEDIITFIDLWVRPSPSRGEGKMGVRRNRLILR